MLLPALSLSAARGDERAFGTLLQRALRLAVVGTVPLAALGIPLAEPGIQLLLERGAFTADSSRATATALAWYCPAIVGMAGVHVLTRAFHAVGAFRRFAAVHVAVAAAHMALVPALALLVGFRGLPLAASLTWSLLFASMLWALRARLTAAEMAGIVRPLARVLLAGGVALAATAAGIAAVPSPAIGVVAAAALGLGAYAVALRALAPAEWTLAVEFATAPRPPTSASGRRAGDAACKTAPWV
jgi:putative peptidoglycan lipid II flippase